MKKEPRTLQFVRHQTEGLCLEAIKQDPSSFTCIKNPSEHLCLEAVKRSAKLIQFVKHQTPELVWTAVRKNGLMIQYVKEQTPELCQLAVQKNPLAIRYVKEPTERLCFEALKRNPKSFKHLSTEQLSVERLRLEVVKFDGAFIQSVSEPTPEMVVELVHQGKLKNLRQIDYSTFESSIDQFNEAQEETFQTYRMKGQLHQCSSKQSPYDILSNPLT